MKVEIVRKREGVEVCHFPDYGASPFLQDLKRSGKNVSLGSPVFTKEVVDFIKWYLTPSVITPDSTTDPTKLSFSSSSSLSQNGSPSSFLFSPTQPLKEESEIEKRTFYRPKQGKGEFLQNAIIAANNFGLHCLVYVIAKHIRQILIDSESAAALRDKLDFENDLDLTQEKEDTVWTRNCIQTCEIEPEATEEDLLQSFFRDDILLPSPSPALAHPDITAAKCSFENCSLRFGFSTRKHHCRSCGKIFCATHASKFIRLPEGEGVKVEVGWVSNFFTYVMNFGDTSLSRTCDDCFKRIEEEEMSQSLFEAFGLIGFEISLLNRAMVVSHLWRKAAQKCQGILVNVQYKLSGDTLSLMEKKSLWNNREFFMGHPRWLIQIVRMADLSTESISKEVHRVVRGKKKISCNSVMCQVDFSCDHGQKPHRQVSTFILSLCIYLPLFFLLHLLLTPSSPFPSHSTSQNPRNVKMASPPPTSSNFSNATSKIGDFEDLLQNPSETLSRLKESRKSASFFPFLSKVCDMSPSLTLLLYFQSFRRRPTGMQR